MYIYIYIYTYTYIYIYIYPVACVCSRHCGQAGFVASFASMSPCGLLWK